MKKLSLLVFIFSCICSVVHSHESQTKLHFDTDHVVIDNQTIYVCLAGDWVETDVIRTDELGLYLYSEDVKLCGNRRESSTKLWHCPYCGYWWKMGEKCTNKECPTVQWEKKQEDKA